MVATGQAIFRVVWPFTWITCSTGGRPFHKEEHGMCTISVRGAATLAAMLILPTVAWAQAAREGSIYNGQNHEPSAPGVRSGEAAAGVAPSQQQQRREDQDVEAIDRKLLENVKKSPQQPGSGDNAAVKPGGVVKITPNAGAAGSGGGAGGGGR
jgi:hypothetical protein